MHRARVLACWTLLISCSTACGRGGPPVLTFSGSALGAEADIVRIQLERFAAQHPGVRTELRVTPDAADQRHQLYVQWLNARATEPDVLQLDVVWTAEFAAAGWILPLDAFRPDAQRLLPRRRSRRDRWRGTLYALPWFVDVGLLYWRTDLLQRRHRARCRSCARRRDGSQRRGLAIRPRLAGQPATRAWSPSSSSIWARSAAASSTSVAA